MAIQQFQRSFNEHNVNIEPMIDVVFAIEVGTQRFLNIPDSDIRRISDDRIKPARLEDFRKFLLPIEDVDAVAFFVIELGHLLLLIKIGADERVAAFDVVAKIGQGAFLEHAQDGLETLLSFAFEDLQ